MLYSKTVWEFCCHFLLLNQIIIIVGEPIFYFLDHVQIFLFGYRKTYFSHFLVFVWIFLYGSQRFSFHHGIKNNRRQHICKSNYFFKIQKGVQTYSLVNRNASRYLDILLIGI